MLIVVVALCWNGSHKLIATFCLKHGTEAARDPEGHLLPIHHLVSIYLFFLQDMELVLMYMKTDWFQSLDGVSLSLSLSHMLIKMVSIYTTNLSVSQSNLISLFPLIVSVAWALESFMCWNYVLPCNKNYEQNGFFFQNQNNHVHQENFLADLATKLFLSHYFVLQWIIVHFGMWCFAMKLVHLKCWAPINNVPTRCFLFKVKPS